MGYLAIMIGIATLITLSMFNMQVTVTAFSAAFVVTLIAGLPFTDTLTNVFFTRFGAIAGQFFPLFFFGAILAKLYSHSGAASSIAEAISNALFKRATTEKRKYALGFLSVIISAAVLCYGGINAGVVLVAIYPIALNIFKRAGIPKRFIIGAITGGAFTFALAGPGSPQPTNVIAMSILGTGSTVGLVAGVIGSVVQIVMMVLIYTLWCARATANGETFVAGPKDNFLTLEVEPPKFLLSMLPLAILLIVFNILQVNISLAILLTVVISGFLFFPKLGRGKIVTSISEGATVALQLTCALASINGFAAVIQSTAEYQNIIDGILGATMHPALLLMLCVAFICMLTGGSATGLQITLSSIAPTLVDMGLSLPFIHRVGAFASVTMDSVPNSGAIIMAMNYADLKMKDGYPPVIATDFGAQVVGLIVVAFIMTAFPNLP